MENDLRRRNFFTKLLGAAALAGLSTISKPLAAAAELEEKTKDDPGKIFTQLKGRHKLVFDCISHHDGAALAWGHTFLKINNELGIPDSQLSLVVVLRSGAIAMAFPDAIWDKYEFGEIYKANDPATTKPSRKNPYYKPVTEDVIASDMAIEKLQARGALFCVCKSAIEGNSERIAAKLSLRANDVKNDLLANILPGIVPVPAGIWAVSRAQDAGCAYSYGG